MNLASPHGNICQFFRFHESHWWTVIWGKVPGSHEACTGSTKCIGWQIPSMPHLSRYDTRSLQEKCPLFLPGSSSFFRQLFQKHAFRLFLQAPLSNSLFVDLTTHPPRNQQQRPPVATRSAGFFLLLSFLAQQHRVPIINDKRGIFSKFLVTVELNLDLF